MRMKSKPPAAPVVFCSGASVLKKVPPRRVRLRRALLTLLVLTGLTAAAMPEAAFCRPLCMPTPCALPMLAAASATATARRERTTGILVGRLVKRNEVLGGLLASDPVSEKTKGYG